MTAGCSHPIVEAWDCGCSWGCSLCALNFECLQCGNKLKQAPKTARRVSYRDPDYAELRKKLP